MVYILDNLAVGSFDDAGKAPLEIDSFLNVAEEIDFYPDKKEYLKIPIRDFSPIPSSQMLQAVNWLRENIIGHKIMIFCSAGIGRSSSVAIGYLCYAGLGFGQAVEFVARKKPDISILPNLITTIDEVLKKG